MDIDNHPTRRSFTNHVILYAKGQYKFTPIEGMTEAQTIVVIFAHFYVNGLI